MLLEEGHALLGAGRCLLELGRPVEGAERVLEARRLFSDLEARPLVAESDALLERTRALSA